MGPAEQNTLVVILLMEMYAFKFFQKCDDNVCYFPSCVAGLYDNYNKDRFLLFTFDELSLTLVMFSGQTGSALGRMYKECTL